MPDAFDHLPALTPTDLLGTTFEAQTRQHVRPGGSYRADVRDILNVGREIDQDRQRRLRPPEIDTEIDPLGLGSLPTNLYRDALADKLREGKMAELAERIEEIAADGDFAARASLLIHDELLRTNAIIGSEEAKFAAVESQMGAIMADFRWHMMMRYPRSELAALRGMTVIS